MRRFGILEFRKDEEGKLRSRVVGDKEHEIVLRDLDEFAVDLEELLICGGVVSRSGGDLTFQISRKLRSSVFPIAQKVFIGNELRREKVSFSEVWSFRRWLIESCAEEAFFPLINLRYWVVGDGVRLEMTGAGGGSVEITGVGNLRKLWRGVCDIVFSSKGSVEVGGVKFAKSNKAREYVLILTPGNRTYKKIIPCSRREACWLRILLEKVLLSNGWY